MFGLKSETGNWYQINLFEKAGLLTSLFFELCLFVHSPGHEGDNVREQIVPGCNSLFVEISSDGQHSGEFWPKILKRK